MDDKESKKDKINNMIDQICSRYAFATYEDTGKIMVYEQDKGTYKEAESTITRVCCDNEDTNTTYAKAMIELNIRGRTYRTRPYYKDAVCINNGILIFEGTTFKVIPYTPKLLFTSKVNVNYIPNADCPIWKQTVSNMLPEITDQKVLQEWYGYHFMPGQPYEKALFMTGKPSTGKSTTIAVLNWLLGGCVCHHQLVDFQVDRNYCTADLFGKLGNTYTDMGTGVISDAGIFKVLTGSMDTLSARFPYEKPFAFMNQAKLTFASNRLPPLSSNVQADQAFWKRVLLLQFSQVIKSKDENIYTKLKLELPGILNWALEGYIRLVNNKGNFTMNTSDVYDAWVTSAYSVNPLTDFIEERCIVGIDFYCECNTLKANYEKWCISNLEIPVSISEFRSSLAQKGIFESRKLNQSSGMKDRIYKGIAFN
jgi:putative DNA primase/helicase